MRKLLTAFIVLLTVNSAYAFHISSTKAQQALETLINSSGQVAIVGSGGASFTANSFVYAGVGGELTSTSAPTNGQLLIGSTGATPVVGSLTGTANQISIVGGAGTVTLSTPQNIHTAAGPTFASLTLSGLTANSFLYSGVGGLLATTTAPTNGQLLIGSTGAAPVLAGLTGTANRVTVTNAAGSITLSTPQNIHTGASPTFAGMTISGLTAGRVPFAGTGGLLSDDASHCWDNTNKRVGIGTCSPVVPIHVYQNLGQGFYEMLRLANTNGGSGTGSYISFASGGNPPVGYVGALATGSNAFELRFYVANSAGTPFQAAKFDEAGTFSLLVGGITAPSAKFGSSGTSITQIRVYSPSLTPASVAAATCAEQTFTVTGLTTADKVFINPPATGNATSAAQVRVSAVDTFAVTYCNPTAGALTPAAGTVAIVAIRS